MLVDCDWLYGVVGLFYPTVGGAIRHGDNAGLFSFHIDQYANQVVFDFGACDYIVSVLSAVQSSFIGARCGYEKMCGISCVFVNYTPDSALWSVGACIVMILVGLIRVIHIREDVAVILMLKVAYLPFIVCV